MIQGEQETHNWGETDRDARRVEWASHRLALCNMEWDRILAADIFVMISSFKPPAPAGRSFDISFIMHYGERLLD